MAARKAMYVFEVVVQSVKSFVESRMLVIRSEFADIFSLELKDPKQMYIVMPEPLPLPPEPVGKKGKKKPKPKPKKGKKGKKVKEELPPPEPIIQSGQSVLFTSTAELLIEAMKKNPMEVSLWSQEDNLVFIGASIVPWDPVFLTYLEQISKCTDAPPPTVNDEYNVFQEGTAKLMARLGIQVKLSCLTDRVVSCFRTLTEDPIIKKVLYTGMNSKVTSYICNYKTTDETFTENCNKIENNYVKDKIKPLDNKPINYADYKNAPAANITSFNDSDYCCIGQADKPPDSKYNAPESCPDIDFIADYVRKIITSCNDNMRMLTPRPTIRPRIKATDVDKLCYCRETRWPDGDLAKRFRRETQGGPCPLCINTKPPGAPRELTLDIADIRGPCGRADCRIARDMRVYLENLVKEDNEIFNLDDLIGPCGSKSCTLAEKIQDFLRHEGAFKKGTNMEGLSTQCACLQQMQTALTTRDSCESVCEKDCEDSESETCEGKGCPYRNQFMDRVVPEPKENEAKGKELQVYTVFYFTVEHDFENDADWSKNASQAPSSNLSQAPSSSTFSPGSSSTKYKHCSTDCPTKEDPACAKSVCSSMREKDEADSKLSPADSNIVIQLKDIHNPCCVRTCAVADSVKDFIEDSVRLKAEKAEKPYLDEIDPCYCDCDCTYKFTSKTTYCAICGGYESLGADMKAQPEYAKPHPCPVYHKLYNKKLIQVKSPWPEVEEIEKPSQAAVDAQSTKSTKTQASKAGALSTTRSNKGLQDKKKAPQKIKKKTKKVRKVPQEQATQEQPPAEKKASIKSYHITPVPKSMGWLWTAEDVPGLKFRPNWKPGAAHKLLVRRYKTVREGVDNIAKKKRAMLSRKKKIEMKPTLVVKKTDGEYTVQMEVFKKYSNERFLFQYPYDEKPPLIYTIGKTEEEKVKKQKQRERRERRETRRKSRLLQSTFRDKCQEICLKAYNQAIGLAPLSNPNNPECPCGVEAIKPPSPPIDSCSCSESVSVSSSDTDGDDWIIEFTPPLARWDPKAKHPLTLVENESQYTYLDYKVKLLDKQGNPVPRYFKGPDGKEECSDLGGFWGAGHQWLEINKDGYIGPDVRWVPLNFTGPDGMFYTSEEGTFTDHQGKVWKIGIDGYIDKDGKWAWYSRQKGCKMSKSTSMITGTTDTKKSKKPESPKPETHKEKGKTVAKANERTVGGKGKEVKVADKKSPMSPIPAKGGAGNVNKAKKAVSMIGVKGKNLAVMNVSLSYDVRKNATRSQMEKKLLMDPKKINQYNEIMHGLKIYDNLCEYKQPAKTNRASNTPRKKISPFTMDRCFGNPQEHYCSNILSSTYDGTSTTFSCLSGNHLERHASHCVS